MTLSSAMPGSKVKFVSRAFDQAPATAKPYSVPNYSLCIKKLSLTDGWTLALFLVKRVFTL